jgi:hypothetical protein
LTIEDHEKTRLQLLNIIGSGIVPKPIVEIRFHEIEDGCVIELIVPNGALKPYQNLRNGSFYLRGDGQNVVIPRDQVRSMFVSEERYAERADEVMKREDAELLRRNLLHDDGPTLHLCIVPMQAFENGRESLQLTTPVLRSFRPFDHKYGRSGIFQGCEFGFEARDSRSESSPSFSRLFVGMDWTVHTGAAWPIEPGNHDSVDLTSYRGNFKEYVRDVLNFLREEGIEGPYHFSVRLDNLHRNDRVKFVFPTTRRVDSRPVLGDAESVMASLDGFLDRVYSCSRYGP